MLIAPCVQSLGLNLRLMNVLCYCWIRGTVELREGAVGGLPREVPLMLGLGNVHVAPADPGKKPKRGRCAGGKYVAVGR